MMRAYEVNKKICSKHGLQYFFLHGGCEKCQEELYKTATVTIGFSDGIGDKEKLIEGWYVNE